jgi:hypothetical protein
MIVVYDFYTEEMVTMMSEGMWQTQRMCKSPDVEEKTPLQDSLEHHPMAEELKKLRR